MYYEEDIITTTPTIQKHENSGTFQTALPVDMLNTHVYPTNNQALSAPIQDFTTKVVLLVGCCVKPLPRWEQGDVPLVHNHHTLPHQPQKPITSFQLMHSYFFSPLICLCDNKDNPCSNPELCNQACYNMVCLIHHGHFMGWPRCLAHYLQ